jgi:hypothetical protein
VELDGSAPPFGLSAEQVQGVGLVGSFLACAIVVDLGHQLSSVCGHRTVARRAPAGRTMVDMVSRRT